MKLALGGSVAKKQLENGSLGSFLFFDVLLLSFSSLFPFFCSLSIFLLFLSHPLSSSLPGARKRICYDECMMLRGGYWLGSGL